METTEGKDFKEGLRLVFHHTDGSKFEVFKLLAGNAQIADVVIDNNNYKNPEIVNVIYNQNSERIAENKIMEIYKIYLQTRNLES